MEQSANDPAKTLCDNSIAISDRLLSYADVAERMGVSIHTVRGWVYQRKIPYLKAGKIVRFIWADVMQWLQTNGA
jgi:excisionase family DNA binding protein